MKETDAHSETESVVDYTGRPLYMISCGELGTEAASLEENLSRTLHFAALWEAVVLLDEAEVFLEQRSMSDLQRNGLVSSEISESSALKKTHHCYSLLTPA